MRSGIAGEAEASAVSFMYAGDSVQIPDIATFFEAFDVPHVLMSQDRRLLAANQPAQAVIRSGDWLVLGADDILTPAPHLKGPLDNAIRRGGRSMLLIPDAKTDSLAAIRVSAGLGMVHLVVRTDVLERQGTLAVDFTTAYDLTNAEKRVAAELVTNRALAEIAVELGVSLETIRTHKRRIFQKMNVSSRSGLFSILTRAIA